eukprot:TRINITY_DN10238_c0_g3_i2.p1 TRINITY_DN10238_c0_g3~~TRINITY_DN10238_c0_g3_i2.p1  ORF type:complete len:130 (-),score=28.81 TRINITY_DN10238_c0_g3_i2:317-706(-)
MVDYTAGTSDTRAALLQPGESEAEEAAAGVLVFLGTAVSAFCGVIGRALQGCGDVIVYAERRLDDRPNSSKSGPPPSSAVASEAPAIGAPVFVMPSPSAPPADSHAHLNSSNSQLMNEQALRIPIAPAA